MEEIQSFKDIKHSASWKTIEPINKGWSGDKKYYIETAQAEKLLLRVSDIAESERKKAEFVAVQAISSLDINMSQPLEFGVFNDDLSVYSLFSWVEGEDAEVVLPTLSEQKQYELGWQAGESLKVIHSLKGNPQHDNWSTYFNQKMDKKIMLYEQCKLQFPHSQKLIRFLEAHRHLLEGREQSFHHGDFHVGNLVINHHQIGVIDFNRFDVGDPWEEFNRIVFSTRVSKAFTVGQIDGYFDGKVPDEFFPLMALYIGTNALSSLPWALQFENEEIDTMLAIIESVMDDYQHFTEIVPRWYRAFHK